MRKSVMTKKQEQQVKQCFEDTIWMAIRYAHGRSTYAPSMVRDAVKLYQSIYPDFKLKQDVTIEAPHKEDLNLGSCESDYLHDLFER
jgi:hypothetical protein